MRNALIPFLAALILPVGLAHADCAAPADQTEAAICASPVLQRLESQMQAALEQTGAQGQQDWLAKRRVCGARLSCIASMTRQRTQTLLQEETAPPDWSPEKTPLGQGTLRWTDTYIQIAETRVALTRVDGRSSTFALATGLSCGGAPARFLTMFETGDQRLILALFTGDEPPADPTPANYHAQPGACETAIYRR